ncbi:glycosyltransferase [Vibrio maritimus]|uniref:glycosyltransferase n=1 Tax=Vibrio maritimus TaxID=990268 RepID=UPI004067A72A
MKQESISNIVVFSNHLLAYSETFILAQGESLRRYKANYMGSDFVPNGLQTPKGRSFVLNRGRFGSLVDKALKLGIVLPRATKQIKEIQPKLCHAHFGPNGMTAVPLSNKLKIPLVVTFHGFDLIESPTVIEHGRLHVNYYRNRHRLNEKVTKFIAVSERVKQRMLYAGFPKEKIIRHYIGIDTKKFTPDQSVARENLVVCVGRMSKYKGQEYLIRAMAGVQKEHSDYRLVLIGDGDERASLERLASQHSVNITFTGRQTPEQVVDWMRKAKVYVQPSVRLKNGQEEALALTIVEAQAVGTPAVVFSSGGMREAINPGRSGFVVDSESTTQLANAISNLVSDQCLWESFSDEARRYVLEVHDLEKQTEKLESIYEQAIRDYRA